MIKSENNSFDGGQSGGNKADPKAHDSARTSKKAAGAKSAARSDTVKAADQAAIDELLNELIGDAAEGNAPKDGAASLEADAEGEPEVELDPLAQALAEAEQYRDRFTRLQAEWDNFRKRTAAERNSERERAAAKLVEQLLPIIDDLERAIEHSDSASEASLKEGIAAVYTKLGDVLQKEGLKTINPVDEAFDANIHQAVGKVDDTTVPDETVTQVYQKGYQMGDKVLRSAMVIVSAGGPVREVETENADNE